MTNAKAIAISALALASSLCLSAEGLPWWRNIDVTSINAQTQRIESIWYPTEKAALQIPFEKSPNYLDLNGTWDFAYFDEQTSLPEGLRACPEAGDKADVQDVAKAVETIDWGKIQVPGNWEHQGHGIAIYVNQPYEFNTENPKPPLLPDETPVGVYRRTFTVPTEWSGREVYLNFGGAKSGVYVYINGQIIGYFEDSKNLARFDITPYVKDGDNELLLKIYRWSTGSYLECQDFWRISGIERDVYLSSESTKRDFNFTVVANLEENLKDGVLIVTPNGSGDFSYKLLDKDGSSLAEGNSDKPVKVKNVRAWSAEKPELYTLVVKVDGEYTPFNVGFKRLEIIGNKFYVNGKTIKFKGVNMHEHNEITGHYTDREDIREQLLLMKELNINAIRTCHYPQPRYFYELCDSLGLYVYDEANIESHGMGYKLDRTLGNNPAWYAKHLDRILNMYYRTAFYPSVVILSLGNEAGNGVNFYNVYNELKKREVKGQNRPVCYERAIREWNTDMFVPQYPGADWFWRMGREDKDKPIIPSEYAHTMGNSGGSLDLQWEAIYTHDNLQGGFIWDWIDQGLAEIDGKGRKYWTYGGDYGPEGTPSGDNFLCNGIINPDHNPHPGAWDVKHVYQEFKVSSDNPTSGKFNLLNRFYFTDMTSYELRYEVTEDGVKINEASLPQAKAGPGESEEFFIPIPQMDPTKTYCLNFYVDKVGSETGHLVAYDQFLLQEGIKENISSPSGRIKVVEKKGQTIVKGHGLRFVIDNTSGTVTKYRFKCRNMILKDYGLKPEFWRAPVDNDRGSNLPKRAEQWKNATDKAQVAWTTADGCAIVNVDYQLPDNASLQMTYTILSNGVVKVHSDFKGGNKHVELPRLGLRTRLKASEETFSYFGRGPWENYSDRKGSAMIGLYHSDATNEFYPYVRPQETGHHTDCRWLQIGRFKVIADSVFEFNALRTSIEDLDPRDSEGKLVNGHVNDITPRDFTELCIDFGMTGVGGYNSWGARPEPSRTIWADKDYNWGITIVPLKAKI